MSARLSNIFIAGAIVLLICSALMRTYQKSTSTTSRTSSTLATEIESAMQSTKDAYAAKAVDGSPAGAVRASTRLKEADNAIRSWRKLAAPNHPVSTRRYGMCLFMFGRPGGLDVLLSVDAEAGKREEGRGKRTDGPAPLPHDVEQATWKTLYGTGTVRPEDVPRLKSAISRMNLGWFENIAFEQVYKRAGQPLLAAAARQQALDSANRLNSADGIEVLLFLAGIVMWLALGFRTLIRKSNLSQSFAADRTFHEAVGSSGRVPDPVYSYRARTTAFAVFLALSLFIGYPLRLLMPSMGSWSDSAVLRFTSLLQIGLYIPIVAVALYVLRHIAASEAGETESPSLRRTLALLGLRSSDAPTDIVFGIKGYILTVPLFLVAALVSASIFKSVHTPINPIQIEAMGAASPFNQALILFETAVAAPIVEELMFRGLLFPALSRRWGVGAGVALSASAFGLLHPNLPAGFLPLFTLGAAFAVVFQRRQSLLPCIVMHSLHNAFVTITMFMVLAK